MSIVPCQSLVGWAHHLSWFVMLFCDILGRYAAGYNSTFQRSLSDTNAVAAWLHLDPFPDEVCFLIFKSARSGWDIKKALSSQLRMVPICPNESEDLWQLCLRMIDFQLTSVSSVFFHAMHLSLWPDAGELDARVAQRLGERRGRRRQASGRAVELLRMSLMFPGAWQDMGMDQYLYIPFLGEWTSIYQLFWGSLGTRVLTHPHMTPKRIADV